MRFVMKASKPPPTAGQVSESPKTAPGASSAGGAFPARPAEASAADKGAQEKESTDRRQVTPGRLDAQARAAAQRAAQALQSGGVVGMPTETVYGLAADARNPEAVRRVFALKGRPATHPVIVHLASAEALPHWTSARHEDEQLPPLIEALAAEFWPGPLTLIVPRAAHVSDLITGGQETVGLRVPSHPIARDILRRMGEGAGVAAPSANRFGGVSPTTAEHVRSAFGEAVDLVVDGGACTVGVESTIVDLSAGTPRILRPGGVTEAQLRRVVRGGLATKTTKAVTRAPGTLPSHYAPRAAVELCAVGALPARLAALEAGHASLGSAADLSAGSPIESSEAPGPVVAVLCSDPKMLSPGRAQSPGRCRFIWVSFPEDPQSAATRLYSALREADETGCVRVVVVPPISEGIGQAVVDRLNRAAAPRP